jgi:hypothetical protein
MPSTSPRKRRHFVVFLTEDYATSSKFCLAANKNLARNYSGVINLTMAGQTRKIRS